MSKNILLKVSCHHDFASDVPETFSISMDGVLKHQIKTLHAKMIELGVDRSCKFIDGGDWSKCDLAMECIDAPQDDDEFADVCVELEKQTATVNFCELNVTRTGFYFSAIPEGCGEMFGLRTQRVLLSELDNDDLFVNLG